METTELMPSITLSTLDLKLYELLGDKTLSFGCLTDKWKCIQCTPKSAFIPERWSVLRTGYDDFLMIATSDLKIIWHEPTIHDLHKWACINFPTQPSWFVLWWKWYDSSFEQDQIWILFWLGHEYKEWQRIMSSVRWIDYNPSKSLLSQHEATKKAIVEMIESRK